MDKLSELIKEAKPLYRQRKRRNAVARTMLAVCMPVMLLAGVYKVYLTGCDIYVALDNNKLQNELLYDDFGLLGM